MIRRLCIAALASIAFASAALADGYPTKPIICVVPFAAGGPLDSLMRAIAEPMSADLGQSIVIENAAGAAGSTGVGRVVHAAPDGYTIGAGNWSTHVLNGVIYPLHYDLMADLVPVALLPSAPQMIVSKSAVPARDFRELVAWLQANKANVGTAGIGSATHVSGLLFQTMTKTEFAFVSYRSGGAALQDLVAGHVDLMFDQASNSLPQIRAGAIKAYAVTAKERLAVAPDIPTVDEVGLPGFYIAVWNGLWVPKSTPAEIVDRLNKAAVKAMLSEPLKKRFNELGQTLPGPDQQSPAALGAFQKAEIDKWWPVLKAAQVKAN